MMKPERRLDLPGCLNLRDVGGYSTRSGGVLAWRRLYRSGELSGVAAMSATATQLVDGLGLRRVIDLRTDAEVSDRGTACLPLPCERIHVPFLTAIHARWIDPSDRSPNGTALRYMQMLDEGTPALLRVIRALADARARPTVIHCAAGRDRTGIVIACALDLLDVPDDVIALDYALSDEVLDDGGSAEPETIHNLLDVIRREHGSTRDMLVRRGMPANGHRGSLASATLHLSSA